MEIYNCYKWRVGVEVSYQDTADLRVHLGATKSALKKVGIDSLLSESTLGGAFSLPDIEG